MASLVFDPQVALDLIRESLLGEAAADTLMGSGVMQLRDVRGIGREKLGNAIEIPYLQFPGRFQRTTTSMTATENAIGRSTVTATVSAYGYQFSMSDWVRFSLAAVGDPLQAAAREIVKKFHDKLWDDALRGGGAIFDTAIALDYSSAGDLGYGALVEAHEEFGDEDEGPFALIVHSAKLKSLRNALDSTGRPLFYELAAGEKRLTDGTRVYVYDSMQVDASPTRYYSYLCKLGSVITVYDESTMTLEEERVTTVIPPVTLYTMTTFGATHMYSPHPGGSRKGIVRIKTI